MKLKYFIARGLRCLLLLLVLWGAQSSEAQTVYEDYTFTTFAGPGPLGAGWFDGTGGEARFNSPGSIARDANGNLYLADSKNNTIRKITPDGSVTTLAGLAGVTGSTDGQGGAARFNSPFGIAVDGSGTIYVSDSGSHVIRKVSPSGNVTTFAGTPGVSGTANGTGSAARFNVPRGIVLDSGNNLYVADANNNVIRKITPDGVVSTFAGSMGNPGNADKTGTAASFRSPLGIAIDGNGNLYVADTSNDTIRKITPAGAVSTLAGSAQASGSSDGTNQTARFNQPYNLVVDANANVYVTDTYNHTIRKITPEGVVTTPLGAAGVPGSVDDTGTAARFNYPIGITLDGNANLYIADFANNSIRKVSADWVVTTLAGSAGGPGSIDATGSAARFNFPSDLAFDHDYNAYVTDLANNTIRKVTPEGVVTTLAGHPLAFGTNDGVGDAVRFNNPTGLTVNTNGNIFIADTGNNTIREMTPQGTVSTFAGAPASFGTIDGFGNQARFNNPFKILADANGDMFVGDTHNHSIRKITLDGTVTTIAGTSGTPGTNDGPAAISLFNSPEGLAKDASGNLYVVDDANNTIRKMDASDAVSTLAGAPGISGSADGTGHTARFFRPLGIAVAGNGDLYVGDTDNHLIRKITPAGVVTTIAGRAGMAGSLDGSGSDALFNSPEGIAIDAEGNVYVADSSNHSIRKGYPSLPDQPAVDVVGARVGVTRHFSISNLTTTSWSWKILRRPTDSTAQLSATNISNPTFTPDVEDEYIIQFQGWDNSGRTTIRRLTIYADNTPPTVTITNPVAGQISSNLTFTVGGTAADNLGLTNVWVQNNGGGWVKATGTTNWSAGVTLINGTNIIQAYAQDFAGNISPTNQVSLFCIPSAPLTVLINGGGTVSPNFNGVLLEIGRTYSMTATAGKGCSFVNWTGSQETDSPTISFVMASNLTFTANFTDPIRPTVTIVSPKKGMSVSNNIYVATGTALDNGQLAAVWYQLNGGNWTQATNTANWTAGVTPVAGANTLRVYSVDTFNNFSTTNSVAFNYVPSARIGVFNSGVGTITPNYNGWYLQIGKGYTMTAKPNLLYLFSNWSDIEGNVLSTDPAFHFTVQSNANFVANFVSNPFGYYIGPYAGFFYDTNNLTLTNSGFVSISLAASGAFTAKLSPASGNAVPVSGQFSLGGVFSNSVVVKGSAPLIVQLHFDSANSRITGSVGNSSWNVPLLAVRAAFSVPNPAPQGNKKYTLVIPGAENSALQPSGNGYGTISVDISGNVSFSGVLGDGSKAAQKTFLGNQSQWPFYISPYKGLGAIFGWLTFTTNQVSTDLTGTLYWMKQPQAKAKLYANGFDFPNGIQVVGSLYSFTNGTPLLNLPSGGISVLQQGGLAQSFTNNFTLGSDNKVTSPNGLSMTITTASGLFKGTARNPNDGTSIPINGVLLQKQDAAYGTFLGTDQSGAVYLGQ